MKETLAISQQFIGDLRFSARPRLDRLHRHDELECNLVLNGSGAYLLNGRRIKLHPNTILWIFPEQEHILLDETDDLALWILVMKPDYLIQYCQDEKSKTLLQKNPTGNYLRHVSNQQVAILTSLCAEVAEAKAEPSLYNAGLGYLLFSLWSVFQKGSVIPLSNQIHKAIEEITRYIHAGYQGDDLKTVANIVGMSPETISRLFIKETGIPFTQFRNRCRVDRFLQIYNRGHNQTMLEAALAAGFGSYAQFYRVFTQEMKMTPAAFYKKQLPPP